MPDAATETAPMILYGERNPAPNPRRVRWAACVSLAIFYGCRVLRIAKPDTTARPAETGRRSAASIAASAAAGRALGRRRGMGIVGIVFGGLNGLFLLGSLALSLPGMLWLASVHA